MIELRTWIFVAMVTAGIASSDQVAAEAANDSPAPREMIVRLWPGPAPGTESWSGEEMVGQTDVPAGKIEIKTNITVPTLSVFRPKDGQGNGSAVVVLPGGAFGALAWDLEGTEIARWLADRGITAFVLKYRVRPHQFPAGEAPPSDYEGLIRAFQPAWRIAVQDGQQAVRLIRERASEFGVAANRVGMIGFSAGAATTMGVVMGSDKTSRPDFAATIYGMLMDDSPVPADAPPLFIAATQEDATVPAAQSTRIFGMWSEARRPAELHIYSKGAHGFGMRPKGAPVDHWPEALEAWLISQGQLGH